MQNVPLIQSSANATRTTGQAALTGGTSADWDLGSNIFQTFMDHESGLSRDREFAAAPNLDSVFQESASVEPRKTSPVEEQTSSDTDEPGLDDMKDVPVDPESFQAMKPQLEKYGLSKEDIQELEDRVNSKEGMTWGEFVTALSEKMDGLRHTLEFSAGQRQKMMTLFQKLGFSASESKGMIGELAQGNVSNVLEALGRRIESLPPDKLAGLDKEELAAFMDELRKLKGELQGKELGLVRVVGKAMQDALAQAREKALQMTQNKAGAQGKADTLTDAARTDAAKMEQLNPAMTPDEAAAKAARTEQGLTNNLSADQRLKAHNNTLADQIRQGMGFNEQRNADQFSGQDGKQNQSDAWAEFMGKLRQDRPDLGLARNTSQAAQTAMTDALNQARGEGTKAAKPWENVTAPRVLSQVKDAAMRSLANGGKRLTIQLNPQELGTLSVSLTYKNNEMQAMIRTDNHETAKLLSGQLDALRQSLEDQGIKVSKMEVQTQLSSGQDESRWLGEQGHNRAQDEQARRQTQERMRNMRTVGGSEPGQSVADVQQAILSGRGLHVVA
ncbi:flagellar hook-length control protein FliK [Paucidesulfovibrio gracilis DSM 16080]|uniref:Flagellar hook-length control protein FliK n=1 Tax=Paucidesulfovibrio gracilis DSM 16080 TaxID=1121449 RepID=A0A1T4Y2I1_9BACT|nr:flagellar hook-length control protein FliK [Paucidesulfovibrio gracilis]SKA96002.1 flagellar hook-length control protein FliK [Paucidesulfovibrio gracilis DSM 16080]